MKLFDFSDPFYKPLWIRVILVLIMVGWGLNEFALGAPLWGSVFVGVGVIAAWRFATIDYTSDGQDSDS